MKEFEAPFKDKIVCCSAYELMDLLIAQGISKPKVIVVFDGILNHKQVILREIEIPEIKFRQIHSRKTKGRPDIHIQMPREDYKKLKLFFKYLKRFDYELFTVTKNRDGKIGGYNKALKILEITI